MIPKKRIASLRELSEVPLLEFLRPGAESDDFFEIAHLCHGDRSPVLTPHDCGSDVSGYDCSVDVLASLLVYGYFSEFGGRCSASALMNSVSTHRSGDQDLWFFENVRGWSSREVLSVGWKSSVSHWIGRHLRERVLFSIPPARRMVVPRDSFFNLDKRLDLSVGTMTETEAGYGLPLLRPSDVALQVFLRRRGIESS